VIDLNDRLGFADAAFGGKQTIYSAGLNWYVTKNIRFMLDYLHGDIDKPAGPTVFVVGAKPPASSITSARSSMRSPCGRRSLSDRIRGCALVLMARFQPAMTPNRKVRGLYVS
jgi:hypothetical protein